MEEDMLCIRLTPKGIAFAIALKHELIETEEAEAKFQKFWEEFSAATYIQPKEGVPHGMQNQPGPDPGHEGRDPHGTNRGPGAGMQPTIY